MSPKRLIFALLLLALALLTMGTPAHVATATELLQVTANVSYRIQPDPSTGSGQALGPVHVSWQVTLKNNDPQTARTDSNTVFAYRSLSELPILRGATKLSARSSSGAPLTVTLDNSNEGPIVGADVAFDRPLFYRDTYSFTLDYDLPDTRQESLLVTPSYVFLPAVASGDQVTVTISTPADSAWEVSQEPVQCTQNGATFTCSGSDSMYLAAFVEVSRPDATSTIPIDLSLQEKNVAITLTYFQGDAPWAQHLRQITRAALPIIEKLYGFPYPGPSAINLAERGRQAILGYEGLTTCDPQTACNIAISPVANDFTVLHELAHLWSGIYTKRWLIEGFAELVADETAARLPASLLQGEPPSLPKTSQDLRLDEWGNVTSITTTTDAQKATEDAGYDRSLRFILLLQAQVGLEALQQANTIIARSGQPADSQRFMDTLEDVSGQNLDQIFAHWVFPDSLAPTLEARRQARDRLAALTARAEAEGLSPDTPKAIEKDVTAWRFGEALAALDRADAAIVVYSQIKDALSTLRRGVAAAGLPFPQTIDTALTHWNFAAARLSIAAAGQALDAYIAARQKVDTPRSLWRRFGLLGSDPDATLDAAARAFSRGDFQTATNKANDAANTVDNASHITLRRLLIFLGILAATATALAAALWLTYRRSRQLPEP